MNKVQITNARTFLSCIELPLQIGVHKWEMHEQRPSRIKIDIEMWSDGCDDSVATVDYDLIRSFIKSLQIGKKFKFLEELAEIIANKTFDFYPKIDFCKIRIAKTEIFYEVKEAGIEITYERSVR